MPGREEWPGRDYAPKGKRPHASPAKGPSPCPSAGFGWPTCALSPNVSWPAWRPGGMRQCSQCGMLTSKSFHLKNRLVGDLPLRGVLVAGLN